MRTSTVNSIPRISQDDGEKFWLRYRMGVFNLDVRFECSLGYQNSQFLKSRGEHRDTLESTIPIVF